jgi:hypothetical protein
MLQRVGQKKRRRRKKMWWKRVELKRRKDETEM